MSRKTGPLTPEILVPRLGDYLVERNVITPEKLQQALFYQESIRTPDQPPPLIGQILVEMGYIDQETLYEVITEQIIQLRAALQDANNQLEKRVQQRTAELEQAMKKLAEANQVKAQFVANISHELRTPFTHFKGYLDLLLANELGPLNNDQLRALRVIQNASDKLEKLINDLIHFSFASQGQLVIVPIKFQISFLCQEIVNSSARRAAGRSISIPIECPPDLPEVEGDEEKISWVIGELLDNAIKFSPEGGKIFVKLQQEDVFVRITVQDSGIGIPPDRMDEIFTPFHQLDGSSTRRYSGTGLGLALARQIIEAHGSLLSVSSKSNLGSEFSFLLKAVSG